MNKQGLFHRIRVYLFDEPKPKQPTPIWKVEREENLGSYFHYGVNFYDCETRYRIAVYERDLLSGSTRITEREDFFPVND